jgi:CBS domain-containing protein
VHDVAEFLRRHPPFDTLDEERAAAVAAAAEIEFYPARTSIIESPEATSESAYVIRRGAVELLSDGRLLDMLGEGELFGFASILAETPLGFVARASEDTLVYRIPESAIRPVLERPAALRFVARALSAPLRMLAVPGPAPAPVQGIGRPVSELIRAPPPVCPPGTRIQDAARSMVKAGTSCVLVDLDRGYGIVTDRDIRVRVTAEGAGPDTPVADVMSAPARTVAADRTGAEALLEMLDHGIRHLPVVDPHRRLLGVLDDVDLLASEHRAPFRLRALVARAPDAAAVAAAAAELPPAVIALHDAGAPALAISRMIASVHDSVTRRLIDLAQDELGTPPVAFTWLATGSFGRREPFPGSDVDSALAWEGGSDPEVGAAMRALAERVLAGLAASGLPPDDKGAVASSPLFARSADEWEAATRGWAEDPDRDRGLMLLSVVVESAPVWGATAVAERLARAFAAAPARERVLRRMAVAALAERPPTGFLRDFVLEPGGQRKGTLDIKRGGLLPIEALARWAALSAGVGAASTPARLQAASAAGTLGADDATALHDAFELFCALRMEHQVERLRAGQAPDDLVDPAQLTPLTRGSLKRAFRAVARVQRGITVSLGLSGR